MYLYCNFIQNMGIMIMYVLRPECIGGQDRENEAQQIRLCYQLLEEVDLTVPDTAAARTTLEAAKTEYETRIAICNGEMDRLTEAALVCGYGVGDTASAASAALPTALPPRSKEI